MYVVHAAVGGAAWPVDLVLSGLAGTLVWRAGVYAAGAFGAGTLVIVADPAEGAIRVYRSCGFADAQGQFSFQRADEG